MSKKNKFIILGTLVVILAAIAVIAVVFTSNSKPVPYNTSVKSAYSQLEKGGYKGSKEELLAVLAGDSFDNEKTAYVIALNNGYEGKDEDWLNIFINEKGAFKTEDKSSYDSACENGFTGTEDKWEKSLKLLGNKDGKSAYLAALENGFEGSSADWIDCLKGYVGKNKKTLYKFAKNNGFKGSEGELLFKLVKDEKIYSSDGKSLYEIALLNGFEGSLAEWLECFAKSEELDKKRLSTYNLAKQNGFDGSFAEWLSFLLNKQYDSKSPYEVLKDSGYNESIYEFLNTIVQEYNSKSSAFDEIAFDGYKGTKEEFISIISGNYSSSPFETAVKHGYKGTEEEFYKEVANQLKKKKASKNKNTSVISKVYKNKKGNVIVELNDSTKIDIGKPEAIDKRIVETETEEKVEKSDNPTIITENTTASAGSNNVELAVSVKNNPGILGMTLQIAYDDSVMKLKSAQNGEAVSDCLTLTKAKTLENGCNFMWDGIEMPKDKVKDGNVLILFFDISDNAKAGSYPVSFTYKKGDIVDNELNEVEADVVNGSVNISK
ncbi:MAG: hypothetical protein E7570_03820 [Ruminococcaceae bacterium]|nr:hypothetical protein [Oscillospiraceae bacterium]